MSYEAFTSVLRFTAQLNEFTPIFIIWIVSPPTTSEGRTRSSSLSGGTLRSIGYAISEPFYTLTLARLPIDPAFLFLMTSVLHGFQIFWFWITLDGIADFRLRDARRRDQEVRPDHESVLEKELDVEESHSARTKNIDWKLLYPFVFAHVQTTAASNAALLLVAQTVNVTDSVSSTVHAILLIAGLFYFLLSRLADCYLARLMGLPLYFGQYRAVRVVIPQLANLFLIVVIRGCVRWAAVMKAFTGAWGNDALGVNKFAGFARFLDWFGHCPRWLSPLLLVLSPCLMYLAGRFSGKIRV